jgi:hypothetical protein
VLGDLDADDGEGVHHTAAVALGRRHWAPVVGAAVVAAGGIVSAVAWFRREAARQANARTNRSRRVIGASSGRPSARVPSIGDMTGTESDEAPESSDATNELPELPPMAKAALEKFQASRSDPNRPKKDHFGVFHPIYRILHFIRWSRIGKRMPDRIKTLLAYLEHVIIIHDTYKRMLAGEEPYASDLDDFLVAGSEHVRMPSLFVIEMFPPSEIGNFKRAQKKYGWSAAQLRLYPDLATKLDEARSGSDDSWSWWKPGAVARRGFRAPINTDPVIRKLPSDFDAVEFKAFQIGEGVTAVMAHFYLTDAGASRLDTVWHRNFNAAINWGKFGGKWPQASGKKWVAFRQTQETRGSIHDAARQWMRKHCPGAFAANGQPQPLLDVLIFDELDGTLETRPDEIVHDAMRALGLPHTQDIERSDRLPGMVLAPAEVFFDSEMEVRRTWSVWGQRAAVSTALESYHKSRGLKPGDRSIVHYVMKVVEEYFLRLSISELLSVYQGRYSTLRDTARRSHTRFRMKFLKELRSNLVTLSLDVNSIDRDVRKFNRYGWAMDDAQFVMQDAPYSAALHVARGIPVMEPVNLNKRIHRRQTDMLATLADIDRDYRGILTSAASLTGSMQSLRWGRVALWVALASLAVAATTFLLSEAPHHTTQFHAVVEWFSVTFHHVAAWVTGLF